MPTEKEEKLQRLPSRVTLFRRDREIFCHLTGGVADSLLTKGFFEKKPVGAVHRPELEDR